MMRKLNSYKLLLVLITGLFISPQTAWAHDARNSDNNDDIYKPETTVVAGTVVTGQYGVSDNFEGLGNPADIGC